MYKVEMPGRLLAIWLESTALMRRNHTKQTLNAFSLFEHHHYHWSYYHHYYYYYYHREEPPKIHRSKPQRERKASWGD